MNHQMNDLILLSNKEGFRLRKDHPIITKKLIWMLIGCFNFVILFSSTSVNETCICCCGVHLSGNIFPNCPLKTSDGIKFGCRRCCLMSNVFPVAFFISAVRTGRKLLSVFAPHEVQPSPAIMWMNERIHTDMDLLPLHNHIKVKLYFRAVCSCVITSQPSCLLSSLFVFFSF